MEIGALIMPPLASLGMNGEGSRDAANLGSVRLLTEWLDPIDADLRVLDAT
jgi:hypothetical protein